MLAHVISAIASGGEREFRFPSNARHPTLGRRAFRAQFPELPVRPLREFVRGFPFEAPDTLMNVKGPPLSRHFPKFSSPGVPPQSKEADRPVTIGLE